MATLQHPAVVFREEQYFDWRVYTLLGLIELGMALGLAHRSAWSYETALTLVVGLVLGAVVVALILHMTTLATPNEVRVWFGWLPVYRRSVAVASINRVEVVVFRPIADYGCWGVGKAKNGERALFARGNQGVRLWLSDGTSLLIGSQRPVDLASAIELARNPNV